MHPRKDNWEHWSCIAYNTDQNCFLPGMYRGTKVLGFLHPMAQSELKQSGINTYRCLKEDKVMPNRKPKQQKTIKKWQRTN
jgi:hypothetical protein